MTHHRVTIISDGTPRGTRLFTPKGEEITGLVKVSWAIDANSELATAVVELADVAIIADGVTEGINGTERND